MRSQIIGASTFKSSDNIFVSHSSSPEQKKNATPQQRGHKLLYAINMTPSDCISWDVQDTLTGWLKLHALMVFAVSTSTPFVSNQTLKYCIIYL